MFLDRYRSGTARDVADFDYPLWWLMAMRMTRRKIAGVGLSPRRDEIVQSSLTDRALFGRLTPSEGTCLGRWDYHYCTKYGPSRAGGK